MFSFISENPKMTAFVALLVGFAEGKFGLAGSLLTKAISLL